MTWQEFTPPGRGPKPGVPGRHRYPAWPAVWPHGTYAAAQRHRKAGQPLDDLCRLAENAYSLLRKSHNAAWLVRNEDMR